MATTAGPNKAFFYGTLVLYRVIYGTITPDPWQKERLSIQPGLLYGYQRHRVKDVDYPAIYPLNSSSANKGPESQRVLGTIVQGLSELDVRKLDIFEGNMYAREIVDVYPLDDVSGAANHIPSPEETIRVETYVWIEKYLSRLDPEEWDFEEFRREKLKYWAGPGVMRDDYDEVDEAVAGLEAEYDGTGGRGANGDITKQLAELKRSEKTGEP